MIKFRYIIVCVAFFIVFNIVFLAIEVFLFYEQMSKELLLNSAFVGLFGSVAFYFVAIIQINKSKNKPKKKLNE